MLTSSPPSKPVFARERIHAADFFIDTNFRVIHEDEAILVVDKPAPLAVHPVGSYADMNLHSLLKKDPRWEDTKLHFCHRLDAETSGVILIAKNHDAARFIGKEFLASRVNKKYKALVFGRPKIAEGDINFPLGHDESSGFQTVRIVDEVNGEEAKTRYRVLETHERVDLPGSFYSYLELEPLTGRTHQLRAHLAFMGCPIVGDKIYIDLTIFQRYVVKGLEEDMLQKLKLPRLALHATSLSFIHPLHKERVEYKSEAPDFLKDVRS